MSAAVPFIFSFLQEVCFFSAKADCRGENLAGQAANRRVGATICRKKVSQLSFDALRLSSLKLRKNQAGVFSVYRNFERNTSIVEGGRWDCSGYRVHLSSPI
jgi:hypothetical protein